MSKIVNSEEMWDALFALTQALYPLYRIKCISDMKLGGMFRRITDHLIEDGLGTASQKCDSPLIISMDISTWKLSTEDRTKNQVMVYAAYRHDQSKAR